MPDIIHTAYSYSPKFRSYYAAAHVISTGAPGLPSGHSFKHALACAMGDTLEEAMKESLAYMADMARDDMPDITKLDRIDHGRISHDRAAGHAFP